MIRDYSESKCLVRFFHILQRHFGPQNWWPTTPPGKKHPVYRKHPAHSGCPGTEKAKLEVCVGAILTQNTAWSNVEKALGRLHASGALRLERLASFPLAQLAVRIRSSGYFRQKAKKLRFFARYVLGKYGTVSRFLKSKPWPELRGELLDLYGVGPETADSILLYAGGHPSFVVDAYTRRIVARWGILSPKKSENYDAVRDFFMQRLPSRSRLFNEHHALLVALGKYYCKKIPLCRDCPARPICKRCLTPFKFIGIGIERAPASSRRRGPGPPE